ncbi:MAG: PAS domain-containing protein, partial [Candidatus Heimdallarchaeota archaeon]|nr:PAS domain-containing protein [Candidatus Heimdallarchaeota archaeon]
NLVNDGLIFITHNHKIVDINEPAAMALGYSIDEVKGNKIEEIIVGKRPITQILNTISKDEVKLHDLGDFSLHRRDGQPILINLRAIPLFYDGQSEGMAILLSDLSQHEEFRIRTKQLEQQALLGEVMAIFAHEVRNPIKNISTGVQLLSSNFAADNPIQEEINRLKIDLDRLTELMKSILSFSKTKEYKIESVNIEIMIRNLMERWRLGMSRNNILPRIQCTSNIPNVKGDKRALEQVFTNIIQNALNAMKNQGGVLGIRIESAKTSGVLKMINVDVSDTGPGIPEDIRDRIFEPFFTTKEVGAGLGLAITKRVVSAHNGQIKVESFPGGTVFKIKLPTDINGS